MRCPVRHYALIDGQCVLDAGHTQRHSFELAHNTEWHKRLCVHCGEEFFGHHEAVNGYCFSGGVGEDATSYEPRPADWKPPASLDEPSDFGGFSDDR